MSQIHNKLSRHILTSFGVGGQSGKSTLAKMLTAYLVNSLSAHSIAVLDMALPGVGVYEQLGMFFGIAPEDLTRSASGAVDGYNYLLFPGGEEDTRIHNLIVVDVNPLNISNWKEQAEVIRRIEERLIDGKGFKLTHVIAESNLPPTREDMPRLLELFKQGSTIMWTTWLRVSLQEMRLARRLAAVKEEYTNFDWDVMHNPHLDSEIRENNLDYPAMKDLHEKIVKESPATNPSRIGRGPIDIIELCMRANEAAKNGLQNNEYWEFVYRPYITRLPEDLLPVFRRSNEYNQIAQNGFIRITSASQPKELAAILDKHSNNMYTEVFAPYFSYRGY